eukprot:4557302-Pleurochrysis_carterae.AAC.2
MLRLAERVGGEVSAESKESIRLPTCVPRFVVATQTVAFRGEINKAPGPCSCRPRQDGNVADAESAAEVVLFTLDDVRAAFANASSPFFDLADKSCA